MCMIESYILIHYVCDGARHSGRPGPAELQNHRSFKRKLWEQEIPTDGLGPVGLNAEKEIRIEAAKTRFGSSKLDKNEFANHQAH